MTLVLGVDAAWSPKNPSGVALVAVGRDRPRLIRAAPSYGHFVQASPPERWSEQIDTRISFGELLAEAGRIGGEDVGVVAVDMPVAHTPVREPRSCDKAISKTFGARWCSTHSPTKERPGAVSDEFLKDAIKAKLSLRTTADTVPCLGSLLEVYPHVALLGLCRAERRLPYKLSKRAKNFRKLSPRKRLDAVMDEWSTIVGCLKARIDMQFDLDRGIAGLRLWKAWEDVIDAIVCCWVGSEWLSGRGVAYGNEDAAIWVPVDSQETNKNVA